MKGIRTDGAVALVGMLGPKTGFENFRPLMDLPSRVRLVAYRGGAPEFMATPLQEIADHIGAGRMVFDIGEVFDIDRVAESHRLMERDAAGGSIVVVLPN